MTTSLDEAAVRHVGRALVTTSFALALGFASLLASPWTSVASFGAVAALAILGALLADLLVLPALLLVGTESRLKTGAIAGGGEVRDETA